MNRTRREFLTDVGTGMLIAGIGAELVNDLGLGSLLAAEPPEKLTFGKLEPLVCLMQETPADKLLPKLVEKMRGGTELKDLVAAAALANARTFGGEDYVGFHTMMALAPSYHMSKELPAERRPLPVFKVLYRNSNRIQEYGGGKKETLQPVKPGTLPEGKTGSEALLEAVQKKDMAKADATFAALVKKSVEDAFNDLLISVQECQEVHRTVLPYRAWDLLPVVGKEHAQTLLRQSVHYCVKNDGPRQHYAGGRKALAELLEKHKLLGRKLGKKTLDDAGVEKLSQTIFKSKPEDSAGAVAEALASGIAPDAIGEAISLAANQLLLRDEGRPKNQATPPYKPVGSVHGDGIGVHASDSANAWRNMARISNPRNTCACLILAAYQVSKDRTDRTAHADDFLKWQPYPREDARAKVKKTEKDELLKQAEDAIKNKDQALACALVHAYGEKGYDHRPVFDLLLRFAISEDGALHAEKYFQTVSDEFAGTRPAFRWRQLVALARVTASEYGLAAPGHEESCKLLKA
jgi:hypothetical protein